MRDQKLLIAVLTVLSIGAVFTLTRSEGEGPSLAARIFKKASGASANEVSQAKAERSDAEPGSTSSSYVDDESALEAFDKEAEAGTGGAKPVGPFAGANSNVLKAISPDSWKSAPALSKAEVANTTLLLQTAIDFARPQQTPKNLINFLEKLNLRPTVAQDFNEYTGKMLIVRTDQALEGTRYFHAQFFEDEKKRTYLQHLSFEIRPSRDCMKIAVGLIGKKLGIKAKPLQAETETYALYKVPGDYILWVKRLVDEEDFGPDPNNARDPVADAGTCRAAIEKDIHAHETH